MRLSIRRLLPGLMLLLAGLPQAAGQDMPLADLLIPGQEWELVAEGFKFAEGPAVDAQGNLYFTDVPESKIYRLDASGKPVLLAEGSERTNGLMFGPDGRLYGCRNGSRQIVAYKIEAGRLGEMEVIAEDVPSNDLAITREGGIYFSDPQNKQVWYVDPQRNKRVVDKGIERPNGVILWPDHKTLVVADTATEHLWAFRIEEDGSLSLKQPYYPAYVAAGRTGSGADGMTVDAAGRLYVATHAGVQVFDAQGRLSGIIARPQEKFLSNVVFGGREFDTLYATSSDRVFRRKVKARGVPPPAAPAPLPKNP